MQAWLSPLNARHLSWMDGCSPVVMGLGTFELEVVGLGMVGPMAIAIPAGGGAVAHPPPGTAAAREARR
jgi:hypothetical protein